MRFSFEKDMVKGQCSACPFLYTKDDIHNRVWYWACTLTNEATALEVEPYECPLVKESDDEETSTKKTETTKVYLLAYTDSSDYTYYNGVYSSEDEAREHCDGRFEIVEFDLDKESKGVWI